MLTLIVIPLLIIGLIVLLGFLGGAVVTLLVAVTLLIVLTKTGIFEKYLNSDVLWQKILAHIVRGLIIFVAVIAVVLLIAGIILVFNTLKN